jgi:hypothetical protein
MTKVDFVLIAAAIMDTRPIKSRESHLHVMNGHTTCDSVAINLADRLQFTNPRFNRSQFLKACGNPE